MTSTNRSIESSRKNTELDPDGYNDDEVEELDDLDTRPPTEVDENLWECDLCLDYSCDKDKYQSMRMHVLKKHPDDYKHWMDEYQHLAPGTERKKTKTKAKKASRIAPVVTDKIETAFSPAERYRMSERERRIKEKEQRLREEELDKDLGEDERRDWRRREKDEDKNQMWGLVRDLIKKDNSGGKEDRSYEEMKYWRDLAMENSADYKKSLETQNKELIEEIRELRHDVNDLNKQVESRSTGLGALEKLSDSLADAVSQGVRYNARVMAGAPIYGQPYIPPTPDNEVPDIDVNPSGDVGILSLVDPKLRKEK